MRNTSKKHPRRLSLHRETLRPLTSANLARVAGGAEIKIFTTITDTYGTACLSRVKRLCTDSNACPATME